MNTIDRKTFQGGMNLDDVTDMVPSGDYFVAQNCRVGKDSQGRRGAVKPVAGTIQRHNDSAAGTKLTQGAITDEVKGRTYRFNQNSLGTHKIIAFDRKTNTAFTVLQESNVTGGLGFDSDFPIHSAALIGDYLYWTDNLNNPRRIDVERGIKTNHPSYTSQDGTVPVPYDTPLAQWDISVIRRTPRYALKWEKLISADESNVPDQPTEYLDRNGFQFAFRYIYSTDEYSTLSGYSTIAPNNADSKFNRYVYRYDTIRVTVDKDEIIDPEVHRVEFLVRRNNVGSWSVIKSFDRDKDPDIFEDHNTIGLSPMSFYFYNNEIGVPISDAESYLPFFDVPILSNTLEVAQNRLFLGNNLKGYEHIDGEPLALTLRDYEWPLGSVWRMFAEYYLIEWSCGTGIAEKVVLKVGEWFGPAAGWYDTPFTSAQFNSLSLPLAITIDPLDKILVIDNNDVPTELIEFLNPTCPTYTFTAYPDNPAIFTNSGLGSVPENLKAFRKGKKYKVGIVFYDFAHRNSGVSHGISEVDIPEPVTFENNYTIGIIWEISPTMTIPIWGHSYAIVRSRVTEPFIGTIPNFTRYAEKQDDGSYTFEHDDPPVPNIDYSVSWDAIGFNVATLTQFRGIGYVFSEGDLIKLVTFPGDIFFLKIIGTYLDYILTENYDIGTIPNPENYYIEIITPRVEPDEYWEVGKHFNILNPGTVGRDFSVKTGLLSGDTYFVSQDQRPEAVPLPAMNPNNKYWFFWPQDYGRPIFFIHSKQRRYETEIAWSGAYFPGTETNQLNAFLSGDTRTLDNGVGAIQRLIFTSRTQEFGTVMLAICQTEVASIYLGRTEFYNANENPSLIRSADVVGNINVLRGGFGTLNPESAVENDGDVYWFSAISSAWVRYSKAGVEPISEFKFSVFAAWLANIVLTTANDVPGVSNIKLPGGFDGFHKEYVCVIPPIGTWPVAYQVLDVEEDVTMNKTSYSNPTAPLVIGEIYKFRFSSSASVTLNVTVIDLFHGTKTFTRTGAVTHEFQFVAHATGTYPFTIVTTPPLNTIVNDYSLTKQRINPYVGIDNYPKTVVFSEENNRWSHFKNMVPEWWGRVGDKLLSFKAGAQYSVDSATVGSFHGVPYPAWISFPSNVRPNEVKRLQGISLESDVKPDYVHFRTEEPFVQSSDLLVNEILTRESIHSASAFRDRLSPNTSGTVVDKLKRGDEIRGRFIKILIEWRKSRNFVARIVNMIYRDSTGHRT